MKNPFKRPRKEQGELPGQDLENPYRPIYGRARRVEDIRPHPKDNDSRKKEKQAGPW